MVPHTRSKKWRFALQTCNETPATTPGLDYPQIDAANKSIATTKAGAFNAAPGGLLVEVTLETRLATKRITGSDARVSTINGVNPG